MRFTFTDNETYQRKPRPWADYGLDEEASVEKFFYDHVKMYDADSCDDIVIEFVFENGKAYKLDYSYWIDYENGLEDEKFITEIPIDDVTMEYKTYRDWMGSMTHYGLPRAEP